ncbi:MAG TPA: TolC family protein [Polyangiaceae bacterium]|nr:TolC family protein [Polyangiaceae bacterium]
MIREATAGPLVMLVLALAPASPATAESQRNHSENLPSIVTLPQTLRLLRDRSPESKALRARLDVVAAERMEADLYPNPSVSYGGLALAQGAPVAPRWQHQITVEQPVLVFGQRSAKQAWADQLLHAERAQVEASLAEQALLASQAFYALLAAQQRKELAEWSLRDLENFETIVQRRTEAGDRSLYDLAKIQLETSLQRTLLQTVETERIHAVGTLAARLGFPDWRPTAQGSLEPLMLPISKEKLREYAIRHHPTIQAARARQASAQSSLALARRERYPTPTVALGTLLTQHENSTSVFLGLSVPVAVFDHGQAAVAKATASIRAEQRQGDAELQRVFAELDRAYQVYERHRATLASLDRQMIEKIPVLEKMAEDSYRGGGSGIWDWLDTHRSLMGLRLLHLEQREAVKQAEVSLWAAAGMAFSAPASP